MVGADGEDDTLSLVELGHVLQDCTEWARGRNAFARYKGQQNAFIEKEIINGKTYYKITPLMRQVGAQ